MEDNQDNALKIHIDYIRESIGRLEQMMARMQGNIVGRTEFDDFKKNISESHQSLESAVADHETKVDKQIDELVKKLEKRPWLLGTLVAVFSAVVTSVVIYVINDVITGGFMRK